MSDMKQHVRINLTQKETIVGVNYISANEIDVQVTCVEGIEWLKKATDIKCEFIAFCDGEVKLSKNWEKELTGILTERQAAGAAVPLCTDSRVYPADPKWMNESGEFRFMDCGLRLYPDVEKIDGCCFVVRRDVLKAIGFPNNIPFNSFADFSTKLCMLMQEFGYKILLCDTAVACCAGKEFNEAFDDNAGAMQYVKENFAMHSKLRNGKRNLLFLNHRDFREDAADNIGGTQLHVKDLTMELRDKYNVFVLARSRKDFLLTCYQSDSALPFQFYSGLVTPYPQLHNDEEKNLYATILDTFKIDIVHIHNFFELSLDLLYEAKRRNIPLAFTIHDYYSLCPTAMMLDTQNRLCIENCSEVECKKCLLEKKKIENGDTYIKRWRREIGCALMLCDVIFCPSAESKRIVSGVYPQLKDKIVILPHGISMNSAEYTPKPDGKILKVAFIGNVSKFKGSDVIFKMIQKGDKQKYRWSLIGGSAEPELFFLRQKNYYKSDWYSRDKVPELIKKQKIDVVCLPSICSETYCYTLTEAAACGVPCISSDVGALGERVRESGAGWTMPIDSSADDFLALLERLRTNPQEIEQKAKLTSRLATKTVRQMAGEYDEAYTRIINTDNITYGKSKPLTTYKAAYDGGAVTAPLPGDEAGTAERMRKAEAKLAQIEHSRVYNAMMVLKRLANPIMSPLLNLAGKVIRVFHIKLQ